MNNPTINSIGPRPTVPDERARQIDATLQRVRQAAMHAELEERGADAAVAEYDCAGRPAVAALMQQNGADPTAYHFNLVGLAYNALLHNVKTGNRAGADAAAATVASAAVRMVGAWQGIPTGAGDGGRAA